MHLRSVLQGNPEAYKEQTLLLLRSYKWDQHVVLLHPTIMGSRKIPLGIGFSPFLMSLLATLPVQYYRKQFNCIFIFAHIDDLLGVGGVKAPLIFMQVHHIVHSLSLGVSVNKDKRKFSGKYFCFLRYQLGSFGILPTDDKIYKAEHYFSLHPITRAWPCSAGPVNPACLLQISRAMVSQGAAFRFRGGPGPPAVPLSATSPTGREAALSPSAPRGTALAEPADGLSSHSVPMSHNTKDSMSCLTRHSDNSSYTTCFPPIVPHVQNPLLGGKAR